MGNKLNRLNERINNRNANGGGGIGFAGLLTIVFITLKLLGVIDWSWVWVLAPMWISIIIATALLALVYMILLHLEKMEDGEP